MAPALSVIVVDDHPLFLEGMTHYLKQLPFVASVRGCANAVQLFQEMIIDDETDVIFLDLNIPPDNGFTICQQLSVDYPYMAIIIITEYDISEFAAKAKKCGATAYFTKNADSEIISCFLNNMVNNNIKGFFSYIPPIPKRSSSFERKEFELMELLTPQEQRILDLLLQNIPHKQIESSLSIANSTFRMHKANIFRKLDLKNPYDLALFSLRSNLSVG